MNQIDCLIGILSILLAATNELQGMDIVKAVHRVKLRSTRLSEVNEE